MKELEKNIDIKEEDIEAVSGGSIPTPYFCPKCRRGVLPQDVVRDQWGFKVHRACACRIRATIYDD